MMVLTLENKLEIVDYIGGVSLYRETFNEVYDHVLSALAVNDTPKFHIDLVKDIVNLDLGGFKQIELAEKVFEKAFARSCMQNIKQEMINAFKFPGMIVTIFLLLICFTFYNLLPFSEFGFRILADCIWGIVLLLGIGILFTRYFRRPIHKPSIKMRLVLTALFCCGNLILCLNIFFLNKEPIFNVSTNVQHLFATATLFLIANFLIANYRVYKKQFSIIP
jgi:hypothetical protein